MSFVLSRPGFQFAAVESQIYRGLLKTWKLETGSRRDKTHRNWVEARQNCLMLSLQLWLHHRCGRRRCEHAMTHTDHRVISVCIVYIHSFYYRQTATRHITNTINNIKAKQIKR